MFIVSSLYSILLPTIAIHICHDVLFCRAEYIFILQGSISVSMSIYQTLFCFICTHLTSGEKEAEAIKRNADVHAIHRRTCFNSFSSIGLPKSIRDHELVHGLRYDFLLKLFFFTFTTHSLKVIPFSPLVYIVGGYLSVYNYIWDKCGCGCHN